MNRIIGSRRSPLLIVILPLVLSLIAGSLGGCCGKVRPSFVGVPEAIDRSPDYSLNLEPTDLEDLKNYLALNGDRLALENGEEPDPGSLNQVQTMYGSLLDRLSGAAPISTNDFDEGSNFGSLFDPEFMVMSVHDARVDLDEDGDYFDLVGERVVARISGDFVFAFYQRRIDGEPVKVPSADEGALPVTVWYLSGTTEEVLAPGPVTYTGLVVFKKGFAIAGKGH
jgi:hypothetical protein